MGLPLIVAFNRDGFACTGFGVDGDKVEQLNRGQSKIKNVPDEAIAHKRPHKFKLVKTL